MENKDTQGKVHEEVNKILLEFVRRYIEKNFPEFLEYPGIYFKKLDDLFRNSKLFLKNL